jgi:phosphatidylglycerophosphate synthase
MRDVKGWRDERTALTRFLPTEASDYPIYNERYIAIERFATSFLCKQDFIQPNHITYFRVIICLCLLVFSSHLSYLEIFILAILGGLSDFLDGAFARSASKKTRLGILLDPLADKFLVFMLLYILITRRVLDPRFIPFIVMMEGHIIFIPALSWVYGMFKRKNQGISATSESIDNSDFILKSDPVLIGKVKVHLYAYGLLSLLLGKAIGSWVLLSIGNWLLVLGITAGAVAFSTYLVRWLREPYPI